MRNKKWIVAIMFWVICSVTLVLQTSCNKDPQPAPQQPQNTATVLETGSHNDQPEAAVEGEASGRLVNWLSQNKWYVLSAVALAVLVVAFLVFWRKRAKKSVAQASQPLMTIAPDPQPDFAPASQPDMTPEIQLDLTFLPQVEPAPEPQPEPIAIQAEEPAPVATSSVPSSAKLGEWIVVGASVRGNGHIQNGISRSEERRVG